MEEWKKVTNLVTPGNLIRLGNVNYTTLAACLDLLVEYENGPANLKDDDSKLKELLSKWQRGQNDQANLLPNFIKLLEYKQKQRCETGINALIGELKKIEITAVRTVPKRYVLAVGNPGAGKSTLLNTMLQEIVFESGVVIGSGMTFKLDKFEKDGVIYMDTPGLCDLTMREQAAKAITEALRQEGQYRVFIVLTLEMGRLRPDDVSLIKLVLDSASDLTSYSLVLNQVNKAVKRKLTNEKLIYQKLLEGGILEKHLPKGVHVVDKDNEIEGEENQFLGSAYDFLEFVKNATSVEIYAKHVEDIRIETFDELRRDFEFKVKEIKQKEMKFDDTIQKLMDQREQEKQEMEAKNEKLQKEVKKERQRFNELEQRYVDLASRISDVQQEIAKKDEENKMLQSQIDKMNEKYDEDVRSHREQQDKDRKQYESRIKQIEIERQEMEQEQEKLRQMVDSERQQSLDLKDRVNDIQEQINRKEGEKEELQQRLEEQNRKYADHTKQLNAQRAEDQKKYESLVNTNTKEKQKLKEEAETLRQQVIGSKSHVLSGAREEDDWETILKFFTSGNLARVGHFDPNYLGLADCLGTDIMNKYQYYCTGSPGVMDPPNVKLRNLLQMWKSTQTDKDHLASTLIRTLEYETKEKGVTDLNLLITRLKGLLSADKLQEDEWPDIINATYEVVVDQLSRSRAFDITLSKTLKIGGLYQAWLTKNGGTNANLDLIEKITEMLQIWRDNFNDGVATRDDLVQTLITNQQANSCNPLILALKKSSPVELIGLVKQEDWKIVENVITVNHLLRKFGNPDYTTIADALDLLPEYNLGPANRMQPADKLSGLLELWIQAHGANENCRVTKLIQKLKNGSETKGIDSLNSLIAGLETAL